MKRKDVRHIDTWVAADHDYNIIKEGTFEEVAEFVKNAPAKMMMSKRIFEGVKERKLNE